MSQGILVALYQAEEHPISRICEIVAPLLDPSNNAPLKERVLSNSLLLYFIFICLVIIILGLCVFLYLLIAALHTYRQQKKTELDHQKMLMRLNEEEEKIIGLANVIIDRSNKLAILPDNSTVTSRNAGLKLSRNVADESIKNKIA